MPTIKLKINEKIFQQVLTLLKKFDSDELEVILDDNSYVESKEYLEQEFDQVQDGSAEYLTIDELESKLNDVIKRNENRI